MESKEFVRAPHVVTARQHNCSEVDCKIEDYWMIREEIEKEINDGPAVWYWVSDEDFQKEYVEVPEGSEPVIFSAPEKVQSLNHETVTEKAVNGIYGKFMPLNAVVAPIRSPDNRRKPYSAIFSMKAREDTI